MNVQSMCLDLGWLRDAVVDCGKKAMLLWQMLQGIGELKRIAQEYFLVISFVACAFVQLP